MKRSFPGYYRPTPGQFKKLWQGCFFTFDASSLLLLYQYEESTRKAYQECREALEKQKLDVLETLRRHDRHPVIDTSAFQSEVRRTAPNP